MSYHKQHFRAVIHNGVRRGLRLESIYWTVLEEIAEIRGMTAGQLVNEINEASDGANNLSSHIRAYVAKYQYENITDLKDALSPQKIAPLVKCCPSPTFVLTHNKRIVQYNTAFISFLQLRFVGFESSQSLKKLALTLDTPIERIFETLDKGGEVMTKSGFAIGVDDRRVRGTLNICNFPGTKTESVVAFIVE